MGIHHGFLRCSGSNGPIGFNTMGGIVWDGNSFRQQVGQSKSQTLRWWDLLPFRSKSLFQATEKQKHTRKATSNLTYDLCIFYLNRSVQSPSDFTIMVGKGRVTPDTHNGEDPQSSLRFPIRNPSGISPPSCAARPAQQWRWSSSPSTLRRIGRAGNGGSSRGEDTFFKWYPVPPPRKTKKTIAGKPTMNKDVPPINNGGLFQIRCMYSEFFYPWINMGWLSP